MENRIEGHRRRSIRLKQYDYSKPGYYFITICVQDHKGLFGNVENDEMRLNTAGKMVFKIWQEMPCFYIGVGIDQYQVMPNHFHGIIVLRAVGATPCGCPMQEQKSGGQPQGVAPTKSPFSLTDAVHRFKSLTTAKYSKGVKQEQWEPFNGQLWQRNYYEHVIRGENELSQIREYIVNNPKQWALDRENPVSSVKEDSAVKVKQHESWYV